MMDQHLQRALSTPLAGIRLPLDGNGETMEHVYQLIQAHKMGQHSRTAPLGHEHTTIGFRTIWKAVTQYPLGTICFNHQQYHQQLQAKYLLYFLSKMGIN